ncbi:MAG: InlB B-repeat-containing protein [Erysipelotrichaceae bacterium]|nr:InlB B-repeat-containing protein [Erysipelotrichaceae bacterium]
MKKMKLHPAKVLTTLLTVLLAVTVAPSKIVAEDPTVREYANSISSKNFYSFELNRNNYDKEKSTIPSSYTIGEPGTTYTAYYPDALNYYGETKSIKIDITFVGYNRYKKAGDDWIDAQSGRKRGIRLESDNDIRLNAMGMDYDVTYSFYNDPEFTSPANIYGAVAFEDPDEGNYYYAGADSRKIYYIDTKDKYGYGKNLSDYFKVTSSGIVHIDEDDVKYGTWYDFDDGTFAVPLENESSFSFTAEGKHDHLYLLVMIIQTHTPYKVAYYYETSEGYPETPDYTSEDYFVDLYERPIVSITDEDKVPNPEMGEGYKLDEAMNKEWSLEVQPDGSTVLKVYFEQSYTIKYKKNADDATGEMDDDTYRKSEDTMNSKETWSFERPGYEFLGYTIEDPDSDDIHTDPEDFKDMLLKEEDRTVVLYAQWNPLDYKIEYDKNSPDATGEMSDDDYTGANPTMPSKDEWTFEWPGFEFLGYTIEDPNSEDIHTDPDDFRDMLLKEDDRTVVLYAQWNPLPYKIIYKKNAADATGEMADSDYTGDMDKMPSKSEWTYSRYGYDFVGFKFENSGEILNGSVEYKDTLLKEEDREIELFAQWDPWKYTIKYDGNGGTGTMPDHEYKYSDPDMTSDPNQFVRKGYKFLGFVYTDPDGNQTLYKNVNDFKDILVALGKNSEILLVAQWKKIPVIEPNTYTPPVTGVEG